MQTRTQLKELLDFYIEAGVDEAIGEVPVNHFDLPAPSPAPAAKIAKPLSAAQSAPPSSQPSAAPVVSSQAIEEAKKLAASCSSIEALESALRSFDGCSLKKLATNTVFAAGNPKADIMIIDRPPASDEDRSGSPFSGPSGDLLLKMLASIGLTSDDVYLGCCLPWRPPGGRPPTKEEQAICLPFIRRHIELAAPHTLIVTGEAAAFLLEQKTGINRLRGKWHDLSIGEKNIKTLPIFHPAFLMDHPASKKQTWADLLNLKAALA
ncbi:MAG: uracil-DNA glycosylase [Sneathiella sp.]|nr:uracil-DNA glycosylase [Sneathiella sp.]